MQLVAWIAAIAVALYQLFARGKVRAFRQGSSYFNGEDWVTTGHYVFLSNVGRRPVVIAGVGRLDKNGEGLYYSLPSERSSESNYQELFDTQQFVLKDGESRSFYFEALPGEEQGKPLVDEFAYAVVKVDLKNIFTIRKLTFTRKYLIINSVAISGAISVKRD